MRTSSSSRGLISSRWASALVPGASLALPQATRYVLDAWMEDEAGEPGSGRGYRIDDAVMADSN